MRNLEDIDRDLAAAREALSLVEGTPAEVYSRIVGYYRSVRNWNWGKREEYGERRLFTLPAAESRAPAASLAPLVPDKLSGTMEPALVFQSRAAPTPAPLVPDIVPDSLSGTNDTKLLLFVRYSCPACPAAKAAAGRLGIPVELMNADTAEGLAEALRRNVLSTPTAILLSGRGEELKRARDAETIGRLLDPVQPVCAEQVAV